jgi:Zn-dependent protease with chaperone function
VRTKTAFRFVDGKDEPRLCRIVEPLAIGAGIPSPYVGVIDSPAMNAFACGIRRRDAVLVFTRGLIDGLDDDELAAVAAHELTHVVNGDIRLIAAANVCLNSLLLLQARPGKPANRIQQAIALPIAAVTLPILFVLIVIVWLLRQLAVEGARLTRLMIASSREFIADAEAVRLTHNPAALVSALQRIDGRSRLAGVGAGQDAMMIDGEHTGPMATHPSVADRIRAIVAVTGSMALNAPARRDTRSFRAVEQSRSSFGRKSGAADPRAAAAPEPAPTGVYRLGLTREMAMGAGAAECGGGGGDPGPATAAGDVRHRRGGLRVSGQRNGRPRRRRRGAERLRRGEGRGRPGGASWPEHPDGEVGRRSAAKHVRDLQHGRWGKLVTERRGG